MRVVIAGGGVAGLEALIALRALAGRRVDVTLLAPNAEFALRATTVGEPFDRAQERRLGVADVAREHGAELVPAALRSVDVPAHVAVTDRGEQLPFDVLVVAAGAVATEPLAGAVTFGGRADAGPMRAVLDDLVARRISTVVFALPRALSWSLPLYELALLTANHLVTERVRGARLAVVTPEPEPLAVFGPAGTQAIRPLLAERDIAVHTRARPDRVEPASLVLADGGRVGADRVVTLPLLEGPRLPGLPADRAGFLVVDRHGRVRGTDDVYAAGDVTAFPLKQGGLAAQQADAVAEAIAARAGAPVEPTPFRPILRGLVLTGVQPIYLRADPDTASASSGRPLWSPPGKVAGRYLAPYLATARPTRPEAAILVDRPANAAIALRETAEPAGAERADGRQRRRA